MSIFSLNALDISFYRHLSSKLSGELYKLHRLDTLELSRPLILCRVSGPELLYLTYISSSVIKGTMQYNSDGPGGRRVPGVNPTAPSFVSSLSSARNVSSPSVERTVASGSLSNQAHISPIVRCAVTPEPPAQDNALTGGRPTLLLDSVPHYTPERNLTYSGYSAQTSTFSAPSMSVAVKTPSPAQGELFEGYLIDISIGTDS